MKKKNLIISISAIVLLMIVIGAGIWMAIIAKNEKAFKEEASKSAIVEVFHDQANEYMMPLEPTEKDDITLRLRTEKYNVTKAQIQYTADEGKTWEVVDMTYDKPDKTGYYDYFVGTIPAQDNKFYYRFVCANKTGTSYVTRSLEPIMTEDTDYTSGWAVIPGYSTPSWAKGALWYNINPDAFYNANSSNDVTTSDGQDVNTWNYIRTGLADKYGGDLAGVEAKVDHIKGLYVDAVFLNPFNKSLQNGGYDPAYYDQVEPSFGNAEDLRNMVNAFHDKDMKIGSDAVMTFTTNNSIYFDQSSRYPLDGAYESEGSEWSDLYLYYNWPTNYHSTWGQQPAINHDSKTTQELLYTKPDSFLQYYTREFGIDTWRFDCGGWLAGWTDTGIYDSSQVISVVADNLKKINSEVLLVSENCSNEQLMKGEWDSHWNIYFMQQMQNYAEGLIDEKAMSQMLNGSLNALPRPMALSIYNLVCNHDEPRTGDVPTFMENAQIITMMNYIGSPSIYYGEEINLDTEQEAGLGSSQSFYAMNWDESEWDYERYNLYRSLGELRSKYSAVKTGAFRELLVDSTNSIYAFGRWDDEGTVIAVASQNKDIISVELNARKLGVADGTMFTDWLTGAQYEVNEDGILKANILPGGGVLVKGNQSSEYREEYAISILKNANASIRLADTGVYVLEGKGNVSSSDKLTLASTALYGAGSIQTIVSGDGEALLTIRESEEKDSAAYLVMVSDDEITVKARMENGGKIKDICSAKYKKGSAVKVVRSGKNNFSVETAEASDKGTITGKWKAIKDSTVSIGLEDEVYVGFAPMSGTIKLTDVQTTPSDEILNSDNFDGKVIHSNWTISDSKRMSLDDGQVILSAKDGITWMTTEGKKDDWTFKAKIVNKPKKEGTYIGVVSKSDEMQWVAAGRTVVNGKSVLFVGRTTDGTMLVDTYIEDKNPDSPVIVQLQRTGSEYAAVYSYDDKTYHMIDERIFANYSCEHAGIFVAGGTEAVFDYACFGDSINDEVSYNTPYSEGVINTSYSKTVEAEVIEELEIVSGKWEYGAEGYYQTEKTEIGQLGIKNKTYDDFRLNVTLKIESGKGWAGIGFGKNEFNSNEKEGFLLEYTADNELLLLKNGEVLAKAKITSKEDIDALRVVLEVKNSNINVYAGQKGTRVVRLTDTGYTRGNISFYTNAASARFMNSRFTSLDATWINVSNNSGGSAVQIAGGANHIQCVADTINSMDIYGATSLNGIGVTDFVSIAKISIGTKGKGNTIPEGGILVGAPIGKSKMNEGINVALLEGGILMLRVDGKDVSQYSLGEDVKTVELMIVKKDKVSQVYVNGVTEPVFTYSDTFSRGGAYQFYSANTTVEFTKFALEDIHNIEIASSELYQTWKQGKLPTWKAETYRENYNSPGANSGVIKYYTDHGTWVIDEGVLSCIDSPQWASGVTFHENVYNHFNMELKYRFNEASNAWAAVLLHKQRINDHNESTPFSILLSSSGEVILYEKATKQFVQKGKISGFTIGEWYQIDVTCKGNTLIVSSGGTEIFRHTDEYFKDAEGFLSLMSNKSMVSFDDILIQPIE